MRAWGMWQGEGLEHVTGPEDMGQGGVIWQGVGASHKG